jgi:hypothetical protein
MQQDLVGSSMYETGASLRESRFPSVRPGLGARHGHAELPGFMHKTPDDLVAERMRVSAWSHLLSTCAFFSRVFATDTVPRPRRGHLVGHGAGADRSRCVPSRQRGKHALLTCLDQQGVG